MTSFELNKTAFAFFLSVLFLPKLAQSIAGEGIKPNYYKIKHHKTGAYLTYERNNGVYLAFGENNRDPWIVAAVPGDPQYFTLSTYNGEFSLDGNKDKIYLRTPNTNVYQQWKIDKASECNNCYVLLSRGTQKRLDANAQGEIYPHDAGSIYQLWEFEPFYSVSTPSRRSSHLKSVGPPIRVNLKNSGSANPAKALKSAKWIINWEKNAHNPITVIATGGKVHDFTFGYDPGTDGPMIARRPTRNLIESPPIASYQWDKFVVPYKSYILVVNTKGEVWAHAYSTAKYGIEPARRIPGAKVGSTPIDKWLITYENGISVINSKGEIWDHAIDAIGSKVGTPKKRMSAAPVASRTWDKFVFTMLDDIVVINDKGEVWAHAVAADNSVRPARRITGSPVASKGWDKFVLSCFEDSGILVVNTKGEAWYHPAQFTQHVNSTPN